MNSNQKTKRGSRTIVLMILISCLAQVLAIAKTSIVGSIFGASTELDSFSFANSISTFTFGILSAGISTIVIPCYVQNTNRKSLDSFITVIYGFQLLITLLLTALRFQLVSLLTGKGEIFAGTTGNMLVLLLCAQFISSISSLGTAYLHADNRYVLPQLISFFTQLLTVGVLLLKKEMRIETYSWIIAGSIVLNALGIIAVSLTRGWRYKPILMHGDSESRLLLKRFLPTIYSSGVYQLSLMIDSTIASRLDVGKVTILSYSTHISSLVNSIVVGNLLAYLFPKIVANIKKTDNQETFWKQTVLMHAIICLIIAGFIAIGQEGISLLFEHGRFDAEATKYVFIGAAIYIFGQQTNVVRDLIYRYFYALGNTKVTSRNSVLVSVVNITVSLILVNLIGFYGIILGTIIASLVSLIRIMFAFNRIVGTGPAFRSALMGYGKNLAFMILTAAIVFTSKRVLPDMGRIASILVFGAETVALYLGMVFLFARDTITTLKKL